MSLRLNDWGIELVVRNFGLHLVDVVEGFIEFWGSSRVQNGSVELGSCVSHSVNFGVKIKLRFLLLPSWGQTRQPQVFLSVTLRRKPGCIKRLMFRILLWGLNRVLIKPRRVKNILKVLFNFLRELFEVLIDIIVNALFVCNPALVLFRSVIWLLVLVLIKI